jgi:hypothetical protein
MAVQGIKSLGYELTPGGSGPDFGDDRFTPGLDWWNSINPRMDRYEQIMPRDPKAEAEVDSIRRKLSDPQWNPEKYKSSVVPAAAPGNGADMRQPDASAVMGDTPEKGRTVMQYVLDHVAKRGRNGDDTLTHASKGDLNIPVESIKGKFKGELDALLAKHKIDKDRYTVGAKGNSVHPETGLPEFFGEGTDSGAGDPGGASGDPSGSDMGGGGGTGTGATGGGSATGGTGPGMGGVGTGLGQSSDDQGQGGPAQSAGAVGTTAKDVMGFLANPFGITSTPERMGVGVLTGTLGNLAAPGFGTAIGALSTGANMAMHGVDAQNNPGGNVSAANTGGVGTGIGSGTDPGTSAMGGQTVGQNAGTLGGAAGGDPVLDALLRQLSASSFAPGPR